MKLWASCVCLVPESLITPSRIDESLTTPDVLYTRVETLRVLNPAYLDSSLSSVLRSCVTWVTPGLSSFKMETTVLIHGIWYCWEKDLR